MTCWMSASSKQRTTWTIASTSRMLARNWLPEALALAGALDQPGDVHELHDRGHGPLRLTMPREDVQPRVGHLHDAGVGLDGGERVVRHQRLGGGERVEEGGLADVGQADDTESQHDD